VYENGATGPRENRDHHFHTEKYDKPGDLETVFRVSDKLGTRLYLW